MREGDIEASHCWDLAQGTRHGLKASNHDFDAFIFALGF